MSGLKVSSVLKLGVGFATYGAALAAAGVGVLAHAGGGGLTISLQSRAGSDNVRSMAAADAHVHVMKGGGPVFLAIGVILFIVGVVIILAAASFQKRMGLSPDQTAPPGPIQTNINRFIGGPVSSV